MTRRGKAGSAPVMTASAPGLTQHPVPFAVAFLLCLLLAATLAAQQPAVELVVAGEAGILPDAFSSGCGRSKSGAVGAGALLGVRVRPRKTGVYGQIDVRMARGDAGDCTADLPIRWLSPAEYETRPGFQYARSVPRVPLGASLVRIGLMDGNGVAQGGVYVAGGYAWWGGAAPVAALGASAVLGPGRFQLLAEFERAATWVPATETRERFVLDPVPRSLGRRSIQRTLQQPWSVGRLGVVIRR